MHTHAAFDLKPDAIERARQLQVRAPKGTAFGVERDRWKEPFSYRVVSFDLSLESDLRQLGEAGTIRVNGVRRIMYAAPVPLPDVAPVHPLAITSLEAA